MMEDIIFQWINVILSFDNNCIAIEYAMEKNIQTWNMEEIRNFNYQDEMSLSHGSESEIASENDDIDAIDHNKLF